jgi:hypothetical protein
MVSGNQRAGNVSAEPLMTAVACRRNAPRALIMTAFHIIDMSLVGIRIMENRS